LRLAVNRYYLESSAADTCVSLRSLMNTLSCVFGSAHIDVNAEDNPLIDRFGSGPTFARIILEQHLVTAD
jgi:hypothetical protein